MPTVQLEQSTWPARERCDYAFRGVDVYRAAKAPAAPKKTMRAM